METFVTEIREIRGIPKFLLKEYLAEMGGKIVDDVRVESTNFTVVFEPMEPFKLGALEVGQNRLIIQVTPQWKDEFFRQFSQKTLRAGG